MTWIDMIINILTWVFLFWFFYQAARFVADDDRHDSKVHRDLEETILNRNEDI